MKYVNEYRDAQGIRRLAEVVRRNVTRPWNIMEVCGGQTNAILRFGLDELLPREITLIHGPGCPVCVTPIEMIDKAIAVALRPEVIFCSFGDMLRVPGSRKDLLAAKSEGADVRIVYSPLDAVELARAEPERQVVFFAIGFETTAPANAAAVVHAAGLGLENFSMLVAHVLVPPAIRAVLDSPNNRVQGFLAAGHVCAVMGTDEYRPIAEAYRVPIVVTGFEPLDILQGVAMCVAQLEEGRAEVENQYSRCVRPEGNRPAMARLAEVFEPVPRAWRGIGEIPESGWALRPHECPAFGARCTPEHPLGAPMVSAEGACAAYYRYRRRETRQAGRRSEE
jgi:hydrogenase expression/formation protein HypD